MAALCWWWQVTLASNLSAVNVISFVQTHFSLWCYKTAHPIESKIYFSACPLELSELPALFAVTVCDFALYMIRVSLFKVM